MAIKPTMKYEVSAKIAKKWACSRPTGPAKGGEKSSADASMYHAAISGESPRHTQGSANDGFVGQF